MEKSRDNLQQLDLTVEFLWLLRTALANISASDAAGDGVLP